MEHEEVVRNTIAKHEAASAANTVLYHLTDVPIPSMEAEIGIIKGYLSTQRDSCDRYAWLHASANNSQYPKRREHVHFLNYLDHTVRLYTALTGRQVREAVAV